MCDNVYAVACNSEPMIMMIVPIAMLILRPSCSPTKAEERAPKNAPTIVSQHLQAENLQQGDI